MNFTNLFPATTLSTDAALLQRLHALLEALGIPPPYILVGHSMGGAYIRLFTALYPREVAGLIFIGIVQGGWHPSSGQAFSANTIPLPRFPISRLAC